MNPLWNISDFLFTYYIDEFLVDTGNYTGVSYRIQLRRRSGFFVANILVPSILINYLSMATFFVPTEEKIGFSVNILLAQTVNLMATYQFIPHGGGRNTDMESVPSNSLSDYDYPNQCCCYKKVSWREIVKKTEYFCSSPGEASWTMCFTIRQSRHSA